MKKYSLAILFIIASISACISVTANAHVNFNNSSSRIGPSAMNQCISYSYGMAKHIKNENITFLRELQYIAIKSSTDNSTAAKNIRRYVKLVDLTGFKDYKGSGYLYDIKFIITRPDLINTRCKSLEHSFFISNVLTSFNIYMNIQYDNQANKLTVKYQR